MFRKKIDIKDFATICSEKVKHLKLKEILEKFSWGYMPEDYNYDPYPNHRKKREPNLINYELNFTTSDEYFLSSGFDSILSYLSSPNLLLNTKVIKINHTNSKIQITYEKDQKQEETEADYAICTLPLGILKSKSIKFSPKLSDLKSKALLNINMIDVRKFSITFKKYEFEKDAQTYPDLQDKRYLYILHDKEIWWFINLNGMKNLGSQPQKNSSTTLVLYLTGKEYKRFQGKSTHYLTSLILQVLMENYSMLNMKAVLEVNDIDWGKDAYSVGAYSYITTKGSMDDRRSLAAPEFNNHLIFAGEHTVSGNMRGVAAAYQSGLPLSKLN